MKIFAATLSVIFLCSLTKAQPVSDGKDSVLLSAPVYGQELMHQRKPVVCTFEREADIMWAKRVWRTIDLREKFNHPMYFPEVAAGDRKSLFDVIKDGILDGEIYAFDNPYYDDEFKVKMSDQQVRQLFFQQNATRAQDDPKANAALAPAVISSKDVKQYWLKEDWFFDKARSVMDVRILGMCPLKDKSDPLTGQVVGVTPLFWIYFPQARTTFAKALVFNTKNDAQRSSYDDLFTQRMFSSYVHKESMADSNVQYGPASVDALVEADRVKDEIFKTEHDMWQL